MGQFRVLATMRTAGALAGATLLSGLVLVGATAQVASAAATGIVTGSVTSASSGAPLGGICVYAGQVTGTSGSLTGTGATVMAVTGPSGSYQLNAPDGNNAVKFDPSCGGTVTSTYALQYFLGQSSLSTANTVYVSAITPATGINASLVGGSSVSGTVTAPATTGSSPGPVAGACATVEDSAGHAVSSATTAADGTFVIGNLPPGSYAVFFDPTCGGSQATSYAPQYYKAKAALSGSTAVKVPPNATGIDAQLAGGATITGTVSATGASDNAGICVYALTPAGATATKAVTNASGAYSLANLAAQAYTVEFDPTCADAQVSDFGPVTYSGTVNVAAGQTRSGVNGTLPLYGPPPSITNTSLPAGTVGVIYVVDLYFAGPSTEPSDYTFSATGLPPGLSLYSGSALVGATIGGIPQAAGSFSVTITMATVGAVPPLLSQQKFNLEIQPAVGYWLATANGQVYGQGAAGSYGGFPVTTTTGPVVGIAGVPSAKGYWVVTAAGNVSKHGTDISFYGDPPGLGKHISNIVAMAATSDGKGYYLVGTDGGISTFGDARFHGSVPGINKHVHNIVGMVVNGSAGYMLVGSDGGVFNFGQSHFYGSLPGQGIHVNNIRGILPSSEDTGYVQVGADGGVFNFGTGVPFYGSLPGIGVKVNNIVGIALTPDDGGYFMAGADGHVYGFGNAHPYAPLHANLPVAAIAGT